MPTRVTQHFTAEEFAQPAHHGFEAAPYPGEWIEHRLRPLCETLEVLRAALGGRPIHVGSGYRSPAYNRKIGGARASQHCQGQAADITVRGVSPATVLETLLRLRAEGRVYFGGLGYYPRRFVHVDVREGRRARWTG